MLLTKSQQNRFWREWSVVIRTQGWQNETPEQINTRRRNIIKSCGFNSLTEVDRAAGFDRLLAQLGQLHDNVTKTIEVDHPELGERRRLLWQVAQLTEQLSQNYMLAIARDKFGHTRLDDLTPEQLIQLRNTLYARSHAKRRKPQPTSLVEQPF